MAGPIRVLMSKPGIDGHWRGIVVVSRGLRDAGMEVIFGGFQTCEQIVETAIEEDVDMIGLSIHSGAHIGYTKRVVELLKEKKMDGQFLLLVGGAIASLDFDTLKEIGAANIYGPGSLIKDIVAFIQEHVKK
ncbi:MAG: cobalamin B12-binding domain-containing protein [Candidatus Helarchaeota archaeon]|nr:cobalamin B12-binding domain-containing protein [Candidatus Helarchaeota archaeon]